MFRFLGAWIVTSYACMTACTLTVVAQGVDPETGGDTIDICALCTDEEINQSDVSECPDLDVVDTDCVLGIDAEENVFGLNILRNDTDNLRCRICMIEREDFPLSNVCPDVAELSDLLNADVCVDSSIFLEPDDFYIKNVTLDENFCAVGHDEGYTKELAIEILLAIIKDDDQEINITEDEDDEELSTWMFWLYMAILPVVFIGGTIGNALAIFIMASKSLCKFSFSQYLIILAVFDVLLLLNLFLDWVAQISIVSSPLAYNLLAFRYGAVSSCMLYPFAVRICAFMSSWLVVAFSIDRCISVCYPFQSHRFCTPSVARIVALLIFIVGTMSQIYQPILEGESDDQFWVDRFLEYPCLFDKAEMENLADLQIFLEENDLSITSVNEDHECVTAFHFSESLTITTQQILLAFSRLVLFMILPFTIILISNVLIILEVKRSRKVVPKIADAHKQDDTSNSAERAMSLKLLSIPIVFLILAIPDSVFVIKDTINLARGQPIYTADQIDDFRYLTYMTNGINSAINFLLYAIAFRRRVFEELQSCCRCCRNA